jgi:hypothetical protein
MIQKINIADFQEFKKTALHAPFRKRNLGIYPSKTRNKTKKEKPEIQVIVAPSQKGPQGKSQEASSTTSPK